MSIRPGSARKSGQGRAETNRRVGAPRPRGAAWPVIGLTLAALFGVAGGPATAASVNGQSVPTTTVPSIVGLTPEAAAGALAQVQLRVGAVKKFEGLSMEADVVSQSVPAGTVVPVDSPVDLVVSVATRQLQ